MQLLQFFSIPILTPFPWARNRPLAQLALSLCESRRLWIPTEPRIFEPASSLPLSAGTLPALSDPSCCCLPFYRRGVWSPLQDNDLDAFLVLLTSDLLVWCPQRQFGLCDSCGSAGSSWMAHFLLLTWPHLSYR